MPEPDLPTIADGLAFVDGHIDVLDGAHDAAPRSEFDSQILHVEQRQTLAGCHQRFGLIGVFSHGSRPPLRIDDIAQAVAEQD